MSSDHSHHCNIDRQRLVSRLGAIVLLLPASLAMAAPGPVGDPAGAYGRVPLTFEKNEGQTDAAVTFLSRGRGYDIFLTPTEAVLKLAGSPTALRMRLVGASRQPRIVGLDEMQGKVNYFIGRDPSKWRTNIATYGKVKYAGVYRGVDLVYYGNQRQLEYDLVVAPRTNPNVIVLAFDGADRLDIDRDGSLLIAIGGRIVRQHPPVVYQEFDGVRRDVRGRYVLKGGRRVGFRLGAYDRRKPLVIDPVLAYSTLLGGSGADVGLGIAADAAGNVYVTGVTGSSDFPTVGSPAPPDTGSGCSGQLFQLGTQEAPGGMFATFPRYVESRSGDSAACTNLGAFVAKLNPTGSTLLYSTYIGGALAVALALDADGNAYITGTANADLPTTPGAFQTTGAGVFVTKLNAAGNGLVYSTYLGPGHGKAIAVDDAGNAFVTGQTPTGVPTTPGAFQSVLVAPAAFITKFNPTGTGLVYSTLLGGSGGAWGSGIAVDVAGSAYVTGHTASFTADFPTTEGAFFRGAIGPFVTKLNPAGTALDYSTLLGPNAWHTFPIGVAVDAAGNAYIACQTWDQEFPTTPNALAPSSTINVADNAVPTVTKVNATGSALIYSTLLFDRDLGWPNGIAVDGLGSAYVTGIAWKGSLAPFMPDGTPLAPPVCCVWEGTLTVAGGPFVAKLNPAGSAFAYFAYWGHPEGWGQQGTAIAVDAAGTAYVSGIATYIHPTQLFPTTAGAIQEQHAGGGDAFIWKVTNESATMATGTSVSVYPGPAALTFADVVSAGSATVATLDPTETANFSLSDNLGAYEVSTTATYSGSITLCFPVSGIADEATFNNVLILHVENGVPVDRTSSRDFVNRTICATVTTLSPFVIVKGAIDQLNALVSIVQSFNLQHGIENSLDAKLENAQNAITAVKVRDKTNACQALSAFLSEVQAQAGKSLTHDQAAILKGSAEEIRTVVGCR